MMQAFAGSKSMGQAGLRRPADLLPFPWEKEQGATMSAEEIEEMQKEMAAMNDVFLRSGR